MFFPLKPPFFIDDVQFTHPFSSGISRHNGRPGSTSGTGWLPKTCIKEHRIVSRPVQYLRPRDWVEDCNQNPSFSSLQLCPLGTVVSIQNLLPGWHGIIHENLQIFWRRILHIPRYPKIVQLWVTVSSTLETKTKYIYIYGYMIWYIYIPPNHHVRSFHHIFRW